MSEGFVQLPESEGDAACWLGRVCPECGALDDSAETGERCPRCGHEREAAE